MLIDAGKKYSEVAALYAMMTAESKAKVRSAAIEKYGDYWDMTVGTLFRIDEHADYTCIGLQQEMEPTLAQFVWSEGLRDFMTDFEKITKRLIIPASLMRDFEAQAREACLKTSTKESMLVFLQRYFSLPSFREAEKITLAEYMIARRADYNTTVMQRRMEQLQAAELRAKNTRK